MFSSERIGRYRLEKKMADGHSSSIYFTHRPDTSVPVVLKHLTREASLNLRKVESIFNRVPGLGVIALTLSHDNIVRIYDCGRKRGRFYYVMEYIEGETLSDLLARKDPWIDEHRIEIISQIIDGVAYLHSKGVLHRDICPRNIMLTGR